MTDTQIIAVLSALIEHAEEYPDSLPEIIGQLRKLKEEIENDEN